MIYCQYFPFDAYWLAGWPEICSSAGGRSELTSVTAELGFPGGAVVMLAAVRLWACAGSRGSWLSAVRAIGTSLPCFAK